MATPRTPAKFFQPPRLFESTRVSSAELAAARYKSRAAFSGLGDGVTDFVGMLQSGVTDILDTFSGKKAERQSQEKALQAQLAQQQANIEGQKIRSAGWREVTPWLAAGATALGLGVLYVMARKRK